MLFRFYIKSGNFDNLNSKFPFATLEAQFIENFPLRKTLTRSDSSFYIIGSTKRDSGFLTGILSKQFGMIKTLRVKVTNSIEKIIVIDKIEFIEF